MKKVRIALLLPLIMILWQSGSGQIAKGDEYFNNEDYARAIKAYMKDLDSRDGGEAKVKIAESFYLLEDMENAEKWYLKVVNMKDSRPEHYLRYAQSLQANGKISAARKWYSRYGEETGDRALVRKALSSLSNSNVLIQDSLAYEVDRVPINSTGSDISPVFYNGGLVFASTRPHGFVIQSIALPAGTRFYDLFYAENRGGNWTTPVFLKRGVNSKFHDGPAFFNEDEQVVYSTRSNLKAGKRTKDVIKNERLGIYFLELNGKNWIMNDELPFNNPEYSVAHPNLSPDGKVLYFSSNMPGGYGGMDLYMCPLVDGVWGLPENMGEPINTSDDEGFPFMHEDGTFYFASTGHKSMGGFDNFYVKKEKGKWGEITNMGYPANSFMDDFGIIVDESGIEGYFSSNRKGTLGSDDIWHFKKSPKFEAIVVDAETDKPLRSVTIEITDIGGNVMEFTTGKDGLFTTYLKKGKNLYLTLEHDSYDKLKKVITERDLERPEGSLYKIQMSKDYSYVIKGKIFDLESGDGIDRAELKLVDQFGEETIYYSGPDGKFEEYLALEKDYEFIVSADGYLPKKSPISTRNVTERVEVWVDGGLEQGEGPKMIETDPDENDGFLRKIDLTTIPSFDPSENGELYYMVQIGVFRNDNVDDTFFSALREHHSDLKYARVDDLNKYMVGVYDDYERAEQVMAQLVSYSYFDAFVIAFYEGKRVSLEVARDLDDSLDDDF